MLGQYACTGKNKPLDPEEAEFYDNMLRDEMQQDAEWNSLQRQELAEFRMVRHASAFMTSVTCKAGGYDWAIGC